MVARRRRLPGLRPQLRRLRRRRRRRPARHHLAAAVPARPRRRRALDHAVLHLARSTTTGTTSPTTSTSTRCSARLADADALLATAHELGLKVIVDLVPNHTSDEHEWFQAALAAGPGSPERARYLFRDGQGPRRRRSRPTTGARSSAAPAWTRVARTAQWYLHLFDPTQPDLELAQPRGRATMFEDVLRFWLDRGVDGFRVDVAHGLFKEAEPARPGGRRGRGRPAARGTSASHARARRHATSRCGTSPRCTTSTATGTRSSTSTTATG